MQVCVAARGGAQHGGTRPRTRCGAGVLKLRHVRRSSSGLASFPPTLNSATLSICLRRRAGSCTSCSRTRSTSLSSRRSPPPSLHRSGRVSSSTSIRSHTFTPPASTASKASPSPPEPLALPLSPRQVFSLAVLFLLLGLIQLSNLFTNLASLLASCSSIEPPPSHPSATPSRRPSTSLPHSPLPFCSSPSLVLSPSPFRPFGPIQASSSRRATRFSSPSRPSSPAPPSDRVRRVFRPSPSLGHPSSPSLGLPSSPSLGLPSSPSSRPSSDRRRRSRFGRARGPSSRRPCSSSSISYGCAGSTRPGRRLSRRPSSPPPTTP